MGEPSPASWRLESQPVLQVSWNEMPGTNSRPADVCMLPKLGEGPTCRFECDYDLFHPATHQQGAATTQGHVLTIGVEEEDARLCRILLCSSGDTHLLAEEKWVRSSPHHLQHWNSRAMPLDISLQVNPSPFPEVDYLPLEQKWEISPYMYSHKRWMELYKPPLHSLPFMLLAWPASPSMSAYLFRHMRLMTNIHDNFAVATQENNNINGHTLLSP